MELLLVRHGETDWNRDRRVQGHTDVPLNEAGRTQAASLARELAGEDLDAVYSSDLARARETAEAIAAPHGLDVVALPALRERNFGTWEGMTDAEIIERFPEAQTRPWGDAETQDEMGDRVLAAVHEIAARHPHGRVVVVAHGGPIRRIVHHSGGDSGAPIVNCHVARFAVEGAALTRID